MRVPILDQIWGLIVGEEEPQLEVLFVLAQRFGPSARRRLLESMPRLIEARHEPLVFAALTNELADLGAETDVPIRQMARQIAPKLLEAAGRTRDRDLTYTILGDALVAEEILRSDMPPAFEPAGLKVRSELLDCVQRYPHADRLQTLCGRLSDGEAADTGGSGHQLFRGSGRGRRAPTHSDVGAKPVARRYCVERRRKAEARRTETAFAPPAGNGWQVRGSGGREAAGAQQITSEASPQTNEAWKNLTQSQRIFALKDPSADGTGGWRGCQRLWGLAAGVTPGADLLFLDGARLGGAA